MKNINNPILGQNWTGHTHTSKNYYWKYSVAKNNNTAAAGSIFTRDGKRYQRTRTQTDTLCSTTARWICVLGSFRTAIHGRRAITLTNSVCKYCIQPTTNPHSRSEILFDLWLYACTLIRSSAQMNSIHKFTVGRRLYASIIIALLQFAAVLHSIVAIYSLHQFGHLRRKLSRHDYKRASKQKVRTTLMDISKFIVRSSHTTR